ncbi:EAL domain-containing protein [Kineococcus indalonis]|uniref:EAL domain-containing protein n=1 Tax=Kineococcus indalonis TaxID=2696566 RepID=UPI001412EAEC|nr:EAL domain-containing protein [Kineococcus indalonis]NAZ86556.1 EAL domain-containing protein [Kineococcus indalonis]
MRELERLRAAVADPARLAAVDACGLDAPAGDADLEGVVGHVARVLRAPVAAVELVRPGRHSFPAARGLPARLAELPDELSPGAHVIATGRSLNVADARAHPVFRRHPFTARGAVRSYLGVPLTDQDGFVLGALSVADRHPRRFTADDLEVLRSQAHLVRTLLTVRRRVAAHERDARLLEAQRDVLEAVAAGHPLPAVLDRLARHVEALVGPDVLCAVMLLDEDGPTVRDGAGPSLPPAYRAAVDGLPVAEGVGSCGTALHRRAPVACDDIATAPEWAPYRDLAAEHGLAACTSLPVLGEGGAALGTFALYRRTPGPVPVDGVVPALLHLTRVAVERDRSGRELVRLATVDTVTGLLNRTAFLERLRAVLAAPPAPGAVHAVLLCDVDHFKLVNDSLGHAAGDDYLRAAADALRAALRPADVACRFAGDAFTLVLPDVTPDEAQRAAERVGACFTLPVNVPGHVVHLSASTGLTSTALSATVDADLLLRDADEAMHAAKQAGRARVQVYDARARERSTARRELSLALRDALRGEEFHLDYQPEVETVSGRLVACEALLRWTRPGTGPVPPAEFVPVAEASGLVVELGRRVLVDACAQLARWRAQHRAARELTVWVNVSPHQLGDEGFVDVVEGALRAAGLPGTALGLEITESAVMVDPAAAASILGRLRRRGVRVAIDDFGTGYSSLSTLRSLPVDVVKIDRSFTARLGEGDGDLRIVDAVVSMAHALDLLVVAEGVEHEHQRRALRALGCDLVQGYLLGRPAPAARFEELLAARGRVPA